MGKAQRAHQAIHNLLMGTLRFAHPTDCRQLIDEAKQSATLAVNAI
ncbi:MAG: hypothetical protein PHR16_15585 [Methylovulum sp.]|nr:hypothetical protein [Methylovulum sp.]